MLIYHLVSASVVLQLPRLLTTASAEAFGNYPENNPQPPTPAACDSWALVIVFLNMTCATWLWDTANVTTDGDFQKYIQDGRYFLDMILPLTSKAIDLFFGLAEPQMNQRWSLVQAKNYISCCDEIYASNEDIKHKCLRCRDIADIAYPTPPDHPSHHDTHKASATVSNVEGTPSSSGALRPDTPPDVLVVGKRAIIKCEKS